MEMDFFRLPASGESGGVMRTLLEESHPKNPMREFRVRDPRRLSHGPISIAIQSSAMESHLEGDWRAEAPVSTPPYTSGGLLYGRIRRLEILILVAVVALSYFSGRTAKQQNSLQEAGQSQSRSLLNLALSVAKGNERVDGLNKSLGAVTATLAQSSSQIDVFSSQLAQSGDQIQGLSSRLTAVEAALYKSREVKSPVIDSTAVITTSQSALVGPTISSADSHSHQADFSIPMPSGALAHQNSQGVLDYWLVQRILPTGDQFLRVKPYSTSALGTMVHSVDDGVDYLLTPDGGWIDANRLSAGLPRHRKTHHR